MRLTALLAVLLLIAPCGASAQAFEDLVYRAEVVEVRSSGERAVEGTDVTERYDILSVRIIEGERAGELLEVENASSATLRPGDRFYLHRLGQLDGTDTYMVGEPDRRLALGLLTAVFVLVTVAAAGLAGLRSLIALAGSFLIIIFGLVPALSSGADPVLTSVGLAVLVLAFGMYVTHGFTRATHVALAGSMLALAFAAVVAQAAVAMARLSGFVSDETVFLHFATDGSLNLPALLLGGILIGVVGVLNDVSVSQVHTVEELASANPSLSRLDLLRRAMKVGREHLGAVVNTLPLAYAGASLPLLLLFSGTDAPFLFVVNREIFAAEIVRVLSGGIGLMCSGVIATALAVIVVKPRGARA
jgi:uncharacterized membrane protein